jgi:hypothetical protein
MAGILRKLHTGHYLLPSHQIIFPFPLEVTEPLVSRLSLVVHANTDSFFEQIITSPDCIQHSRRRDIKFDGIKPLGTRDSVVG